MTLLNQFDALKYLPDDDTEKTKGTSASVRIHVP